jgi:hypothetical protein
MLVLSLVLGAFAVPGATAGTAAAPEVDDPCGDRVINTLDPTTQVPSDVAGAADLDFAFLQENATHLLATVAACNAIEPGLISQLGQTASYSFNVHFTIQGTEVEGSAVVSEDGTAPGGVASAATLNGTSVLIAIPKTALPASAAGTLLTGLHVESSGTAPPVPDTAFEITDRAPDGEDEFGSNYTITGGSDPVANPNDTDGDGLNNTFEQTHFGSPTSPQNATGDPDGDGCNNLCEQKAGTDPNKADTDGDGFSDSAELAAGTNPNDKNSKPATGTTSTTTTTTSTTPTSTSTSTGTSDTSSSTSASPADKLLKIDAQYTYVAAGGALLVIVLAVIGRFGRWGL